MNNKVKIALGVGLFAFAAVASANSGTGSDTLVTAVKKGVDLFFYLKLLAMAAFYCFGLYYAGTGIISLVKSLKPNSQENVGVAFGKFFLGVVLCILPSAIGLTASTFVEKGGSTAQAGITTKGDSF